MQLKHCDCEGWKTNLPKINGYIEMGRIHGMGDYTGQQFIYCPWCGKKRQPVTPLKNPTKCDQCRNIVERETLKPIWSTEGTRNVCRGYACPDCMKANKEKKERIHGKWGTCQGCKTLVTPYTIPTSDGLRKCPRCGKRVCEKCRGQTPKTGTKLVCLTCKVEDRG